MKAIGQPTLLHCKLEGVETIIGDHLLVTMKIENLEKLQPVVSYRRDWSKYTTEILLEVLRSKNLDFEMQDIQENWNILEEILVKTTDQIAPIIYLAYF